MFYQNSNRSDLSVYWDLKEKVMVVYNKEDEITCKLSLDELADLRNMIEEILKVEKYDVL